ncbi:MAG: hypothetical protein L3K19_02410 [Thermoplasmata archaeon]|nr:hypothetical protein [Thermoplasmata archaeon]
MITIENPQLRETGPILPIRVGVSEAEELALRRVGNLVPESIPANALIDTGSGRSIIQHQLAQTLHLTPVGVVEFDTPASVDVSAVEYYARFWLAGGVSFESKVMEAPLPVPKVRALIGRDILALGILTYDGKGRRFSFDFGTR